MWCWAHLLHLNFKRRRSNFLSQRAKAIIRGIQLKLEIQRLYYKMACKDSRRFVKINYRNLQQIQASTLKPTVPTWPVSNCGKNTGFTFVSMCCSVKHYEGQPMSFVLFWIESQHSTVRVKVNSIQAPSSHSLMRSRVTVDWLGWDLEA